jgi:putative tryptophan/tyrosine transport system substrate-binding protein
MLVLVAASAACGSDDAAGNVDRPGHRVAFLRAVAGEGPMEATMLDELRLAGFAPGRNLDIIGGEPEVAYPDPDEAREVASRWEAEGVDLIVAFSSSGAEVARDAAPDTDVLFVSNDPTSAGLIADEQQPEGRLTGVTFRVPADRTLDLAGRIVPELGTLGLTYPAEDPEGAAHREAIRSAADAMGMILLIETFDDPAELDDAVAALAEDGAQVLIVSNSPLVSALLAEMEAAAAAHGLPTVANTTLVDFAVLSLAPDVEELGRQLGRQAARLLSGSPPSAVPVEDPRRFQLTLNETAAAAAGLELPDDVVWEAAEVIR